MSNITNDKVEKYITERTHAVSNIQEEMELYAKENVVPIVTRDTLALLKTIVHINKPYNILEFGTAIGYSSIMICTELKGNCKITTIERNEKRYLKAIEYVKRAGFQDEIDIINVDVLEAGAIIENGLYDLVFIDAAKGQYRLFFDMIFEKVRSGGIIISDNIFHKAMVCEPEICSVERRQRTIYRRMNQYLDYLTTENESFYTTLVPIGDGLAITYKR
ncbi:O-methyltransferase [Proteocatella sphenisci]|uniref:O-methyltransferase n=1 Tax=Proteocatella sphenisci TaxID=181070 RepID=UPI00048B7A40|nr:O-methyltransferase [Proteocatella sphenisci]